ncbi:TetR/AcrR family transcriptional regulator [Spongiibacter sp.]|uniref:TetR/AcrR family transcriptional regulator n=1 Tax=Spongiibacter sp. TaxID=2024860 RepID=UPI000C5BE12C|nr:TetR/AcrR family transcriptional regulator [Spongiibacter sp.]MBU71149.1 TetR family transcriptional regulator [Spongiibacter sp.]
MNTREQLLSQAEFLLRERGYAAFSYADLASAVGIRKASIHHHFPTKEALGITIAESHLAELTSRLQQIQTEQPTLATQIMAFSTLLSEKSADRTLPLCAALAAEVTVLPEHLQTLTRRFFDIQLQWLQTAIASAIARGECTLDAQRIGVEAQHLMALIDGVALVARGTGTAYALDSEIVNRLLGISANR